MNELANYYRRLQEDTRLREAYEELVRFTARIKNNYAISHTDYKCGNISQGYMDFTYFPIFNTYLREEQMRFGIVLNHKKVSFELWLMGQNEKLQSKYWGKLKETVWNKGRNERPQWSVLEVTLSEFPDFSNEEKLIREINDKASVLMKEIEQYLREN